MKDWYADELPFPNAAFSLKLLSLFIKVKLLYVNF